MSVRLVIEKDGQKFYITRHRDWSEDEADAKEFFSEGQAVSWIGGQEQFPDDWEPEWIDCASEADCDCDCHYGDDPPDHVIQAKPFVEAVPA